MKYLIFGKGYLGNKFHQYLENSVLDPADITDETAVRNAIQQHRPDVVINCAAKSGKPNIDWCETHKLETLNSNLRGPLTLLKVCSDLNQYWMQLGSGCIYEGDNNGQGWRENDPPNFHRSYYSRLKGVMNDLLADFPVLQLRLRMPLDGEPSARNLITKITTYKQIISLPNSITVIDDLLLAAKDLMERKATGIYNVVNPGAITHAEILKIYKELVDPTHTYELISLEQLEKMTKAGRSNCVLNTDKLAQAGITLPPINERVREVLTQYKEHHHLAK
jgi:3,5-epimerase/4-reductase